MGTGGLEYQMKKLDRQESAHSTLGKQRIAGKGMPIKLDGKFWEKHLHRKRAQVQFRRQSGHLPKKTTPKVWIPGGRRPVWLSTFTNKLWEHSIMKWFNTIIRLVSFYYTIIGLEGLSPFYGLKIALEGRSLLFGQQVINLSLQLWECLDC